MKVHFKEIGWTDVKMINDLVEVKIQPTEKRKEVGFDYSLYGEIEDDILIVNNLRYILTPPCDN